MARPRLVVVGGAHCGFTLAQAIRKQLGVDGVDITIVQANSFVEYKPVMMHGLVAHDWYASSANKAKGAAVEYKHYRHKLPGAAFVVGLATGLDVTKRTLQVTTRNGSVSLAYDALAVCTGFTIKFMCPEPQETLSERADFIGKFEAKVRAAKTLVIAGAGAVGTELASEYRRINPTATISLVSSHATAMPIWTGKGATILAKRLADLNISVVPNARVANDVEASIDPCNVPLSTGVTLKADVFVKCFPTWNTGWVPDGFVDPSGRIKVNEFHQSLADDRVFAIGCCTHTQYSVVPMLDVEIASAAKNLAALLRGETPLPSVFKQTAPVKNPAAIQLPFGDWAMINVASFDSGLMKCMAYCCGCLNPLWPCCGCCGWPCMYPEGEMAGKCIKMVAPHGKGYAAEFGYKADPGEVTEDQPLPVASSAGVSVPGEVIETQPIAGKRTLTV